MGKSKFWKIENLEIRKMYIRDHFLEDRLDHFLVDTLTIVRNQLKLYKKVVSVLNIKKSEIWKFEILKNWKIEKSKLEKLKI